MRQHSHWSACTQVIAAHGVFKFVVSVMGVIVIVIVNVTIVTIIVVIDMILRYTL